MFKDNISKINEYLTTEQQIRFAENFSKMTTSEKIEIIAFFYNYFKIPQNKLLIDINN